MLKIAEVHAVLSNVGPTLRKLASERDGLLRENESLRVKVAQYERQKRIEKIAEALEDRGSFIGSSMEQRLTFVEKRANADGASLDVLEEAAFMIPKNGALGTLAKEAKAGGGLDPRERAEAEIMNI